MSQGAIRVLLQAYRTEPTTKKWKTEKLKSKKTDMFKSNSKQSGESMQSVQKKKRKAVLPEYN